MKYESIIKEFKTHTFSRQDVLLNILKENPGFNEGSLKKILSRLVEQKQIARVGEDLYIPILRENLKNDYSENVTSDMCSEIENLIKDKFPLVDFLVWESTDLNDFLNHLIAQNTIIVEVESMLTGSIFDLLRDIYPSVLIEPTSMELFRYGVNNTIVIKKLGTRYPRNKINPHRLTIEKLIVDLYVDKTINEMVNQADYSSAIEIMFDMYYVNETKLFYYAKARCIDNKIRAIIKEQTSIKLYTEKINRFHAEEK